MWRMKIFWTILSGVISLTVVSCTPFQQQTISDLLPPPENETEESIKKSLEESESATKEAKKAEDSKKETEHSETGEHVTPTPEQQAAAERLLAKSETNSASNSSENTESLHQTGSNSDTLEMTTPLPGLPGRTALRMGQYAPPEEAASVGEAQTFRPNSAEQHGFRSPMLPASLPMDIHGKLTGEDKN